MDLFGGMGGREDRSVKGLDRGMAKGKGCQCVAWRRRRRWKVRAIRELPKEYVPLLQESQGLGCPGKRVLPDSLKWP